MNDTLRKALEEIVNPISAMQERAKVQGNTLNGMMANYLARDPEYLRGIARAALAAAPVGVKVKAREVLEPFADIATTDEEVGRCDPDDDRILVVQAHGCQLAELSAEALRRARVTLNRIGDKP